MIFPSCFGPQILLNFGGNSSSSTQNTENVTQPTATAAPGAGGNSGGTINALATTGQITLNEESPQALTALSGAVSALEQTAGAAIESNSQLSKSTEALVGQNTQTPAQSIGAVIAVVAVVAVIGYVFVHKGK